MGIRQDLVLYRTAINNGYPITPDQRKTIMEKVYGVIETGSHREVIGAAKVFLALDEFNRKADGTASILALAELLGIRDEVEGTSEDEADCTVARIDEIE